MGIRGRYFFLVWLLSVSCALGNPVDSLLRQYSLEEPGLRLLILPKLQQVIQQASDLLTSTPGLTENERLSLYTIKGVAFAQTGNLDSTLYYLDWIEDSTYSHIQYPQRMTALYYKGGILLRANQGVEGYLCLREAQQIARTYGNHYFDKSVETLTGISLYLQGLDEEGFELMKNGIRGLYELGYETRARELQNNHAALMIRSGNYVQAEEVLEELIQDPPEGMVAEFKAYTVFNLGICRLRLGNMPPQEILESVNEAIQLSSENNARLAYLLGLTLRAEILCTMEEWEAAAESVSEHQKKENEGLMAQRDLYSYTSLINGMIQEHNSEWELAKTSYTEAIFSTIPGSRFPDYEAGYKGLHRIAILTGNQQEAADIFDSLSSLKDSLFQEKSAALQRFDNLRETLSIKEKALEDAKQELEIQSLSKRILLASLILISLASVIIVLFLRNKSIKTEKERTDRNNKQLASYNKELEELAFVVSHNLRESARNISTYAGLFMKTVREKLSEKEQKYLGHMQQAAVNTSNMLSDLEVFVGIGRNVSEPVELEALISQLIGETFPQAQPFVSIGTLPVIEADPLLIRMIFHQLLHNSWKFRQDDIEPVISIQSRKAVDGLIIDINDNGIGFPESYSEKIFRVFQRLAPRQYEGTGIGLAIVEKAIRVYGGRVEVSSVPGKGSTFSLYFPKTILT